MAGGLVAGGPQADMDLSSRVARRTLDHENPPRVSSASNRTEEPGDLELAVCSPPAPAEIAAAAEFHRRAFAEIEAAQPEFPADRKNLPAHVHRCLGPEAAARIESAALQMEVTAPTLLTWAWGQAVACAAGTDAVAVGQVRAGPPRPGQAGFFMNTVPLAIRRAAPGPALRFSKISANG